MRRVSTSLVAAVAVVLAGVSCPGAASASTTGITEHRKTEHPKTEHPKAEHRKAELPSHASALPRTSQPTTVNGALRAVAHRSTRFVVRTKTAAGVGRSASAARQLRGVETATTVPALRGYSVEVPTDQATTVRRELASHPDVVSVTEAHRRTLSATPSDPLWSAQAPYLTTVGASRAWDVTHGSPGVKIAIVDSGVDVTHPDLAGKIVKTYNASDHSTDVTDTIGHGTEVASVAAAQTGNAKGLAGAGYDASILPVKVANASGDIWSDVVADGIRWAADNGADVINLSLGSTSSDSLESDAIAYARSRGVLVVAAAGNEGTNIAEYPANYSGVVSVGATTQDGQRATDWSTYGSWVDVAAPGERVTAAQVGGGYATVNGTSFSSPLVAGEAALLAAYKPDATEAELASAITSTTRSGSLPFGHGVVDFRAALDFLRPSSAPTLTTPAAATTVSGVLRVEATSTASTVRFEIAGSGVTATVPVVNGVAHAALPTYGLAGTYSLIAADCLTSTACATTGDTLPVTVTNAPPKLTAPATGAVVTQASFTASAYAAGGAVRFTVDGRTVATDTSVPYSAAVRADNLAEGRHDVAAVQCDASGNRCDTAHPSAASTVVVSRLHPTIVRVSPSAFSPNGDGIRDTTRIDYLLDRTQTVSLRIKNSSGTTVAQHVYRDLAGGTHSYVWSGRASSGAFVPDSTYTVEFATSAVVSGVPRQGLTQTQVSVDRTLPSLSSVHPSVATIYPYQDGYHDAGTLYATASEPLSAISFRIWNSKGEVVRTIGTGARPKGVTGLLWDARSSSGSVVPSGTYSFVARARDAVGNLRISSSYTVRVASNRLVRKTASRTYPAFSTVGTSYIGNCSAVFHPGRAEWADSLGYYSDHDCDGAASSDALAAVKHRVTLPAAVRYGTVKVDTYGGRADPAYPDTADLVYVTKAGQLSSTATTLASTDGWHGGPTVSASDYLNGPTLSWLAATNDGRWYDIQSFRVTWTYDVLQ